MVYGSLNSLSSFVS